MFVEDHIVLDENDRDRVVVHALLRHRPRTHYQGTRLVLVLIVSSLLPSLPTTSCVFFGLTSPRRRSFTLIYSGIHFYFAFGHWVSCFTGVVTQLARRLALSAPGACISSTLKVPCGGWQGNSRRRRGGGMGFNGNVFMPQTTRQQQRHAERDATRPLNTSHELSRRSSKVAKPSRFSLSTLRWRVFFCSSFDHFV